MLARGLSVEPHEYAMSARSSASLIAAIAAAPGSRFLQAERRAALRFPIDSAWASKAVSPAEKVMTSAAAAVTDLALIRSSSPALMMGSRFAKLRATDEAGVTWREQGRRGQGRRGYVRRGRSREERHVRLTTAVWRVVRSRSRPRSLRSVPLARGRASSSHRR